MQFLLGTYLVCVAPRILWNLKEKNETPAQPSCSSQTRELPCIPHGSWAQESCRRGRQLGFGSSAKPGPIPVSPATRGPHAISDVQGSQKTFPVQRPHDLQGPSPSLAFLGRARVGSGMESNDHRETSSKSKGLVPAGEGTPHPQQMENREKPGMS